MIRQIERQSTQVYLDQLMDQNSTAESTIKEQPRRLTRLERARLEALQSFGCEDFGSVMQSAKKVSLKSKLSTCKSKNDENPKCLKLPRQSGNGLSQKTSQRKHRPTKAELAMLESLKSFENNSLADITNASKRIVSKYLNKPKKLKKETAHVFTGSENTHESMDTTSSQDFHSRGECMPPDRSLLLLKVNMEPVQTMSLCKVKSAPSKQLLHILEENKRVLDTAKQLDL